MIRAIRGTRDLLPPDTDLWNRVEAKVRDVFVRYNFHEIRTPIFEDTSLFARGVGEETDIVTKEMFTWYDAGVAPESSLRKAWYEKHQGEIGILGFGVPVDSENRFQFDLLAESDKQVSYVEFKSNATATIVEQIAKHVEAARQNHPPNVSVRVLLVVAAPPSEYLVDSAAKKGIEIEHLDVSKSEVPQSLTLRPENTAGV